MLSSTLSRPFIPTNNETSRTEYRPLEGFVYTISPFNFTAIATNLIVTPAIIGNVVLQKPSNLAIYSNYLLLQILEEVGLPKGIIQFLLGKPKTVTKEIFNYLDFATLYFTRSTDVFRQLYRRIANSITIGKY